MLLLQFTLKFDDKKTHSSIRLILFLVKICQGDKFTKTFKCWLVTKLRSFPEKSDSRDRLNLKPATRDPFRAHNTWHWLGWSSLCAWYFLCFLANEFFAKNMSISLQPLPAGSVPQLRLDWDWHRNAHNPHEPREDLEKIRWDELSWKKALTTNLYLLDQAVF